MAQRTQKTTRRQKLLGNHQKCWIWGKNVVLETLRVGRWPILELRLADRLARPKLAEARQLAESRDVPVIVDTADELARRCGSSEHQGYLAKMPPFPYDDRETLLRRKISSPLYLVLDSIQDPYNFGAVLRCAEVFGVDAVFVAERGQAEVTSLVARTSAGAVNHLRIAKAERLVDVVKRLRGAKVSVVAATQHGSTDIGDFDFRAPTAIVIGNEGEGITAPLLEQCDATVRIPQQGSVGSLNAAVAAGIVLYEAARQRRRVGANPP
ncbi:MAG: 23S rRNA (guanosine(2251)-2'-O)-methyltransferase RlmB [Planctomycetaceae bacterium]